MHDELKSGADIRPICAQCHLDPPDGSEREIQLDSGGVIWMHKHCEDAYVRRRLAEENIPWTAPVNPAPPPPPVTPAKEIALTRLTNGSGPLTKRISLAADGTLVKDGSACVMARGTAERIRVANVAALGALIEDLAPSQAIALGTLREDLPDKVEVVTEKVQFNSTPRPDIIARTASNFVYSGRAFALLDFDTKGMPPAVAGNLARAGGFWPALLQLLPELEGVARLTRSSTSAGLSRSDTGALLPGSDGLHVFIEVRDGADVPRFLQVLHERCWLAGYGWMMAGASGATLERSIIDRMVGGPERLVFEGGPILVQPVVQDKACRRPIAVEGVALDTATYRPLSIVEKERLKGLKALERERLAPELAKARATFIKAQAAKIAARTGISTRAAEQVALRWCDGVLLPDVVLPFDDPALEGCTVGDVLDDPDRFENATLLEGVPYGRCVAKIMRRPDGTPWIHSFAHGRSIYELKLDAASIRKAIQQATKDQVVETFASKAAEAELNVTELAELRQLVKTLSRVNLPAIDGALKAACKQRDAQHVIAAFIHQVKSRHDPRPQIKVPYPNDPWLPHMDTLNEVIGPVAKDKPPSRDVDYGAALVRKRPKQDTQAFTTKD